MTISSIVPVNTYTGNSAVKKFDFDFLIENENELIVQHISEDNVITTLMLGVDYSINEIGNQNGSYIIFPLENSSYNILKENERITLMLTLTIKQESEFKNSSYFNLNILEWTFDYIVRILQILSRKIERCVKVGEGLSSSPDELMDELNESKRIALNAAESALESKNISEENKNKCIDYLEEYNQKVDKFNDEYEDCLQSIIDRGIDTRSNVDLSNLSEIGEKHFINKTQITNCILEIPQNINLEFNNGTLTLKRGSVVVVPNGMSGSTPQYTYKTISNDISTSTISNGTGLSILMITPSNGFTANAVGAVSSGATAPSSGQLWYDTAKNLIKTSSNNGESWTIYTGVSLPIGIITRNTGDITSLNQIFNGFGIIGSTIWCDKGVKAFIPNGRNTDGTLNNIEITTSTVKLINRDIPSIGMWHFTLTSNGDIVDWDDYKIVQSYNDITINTCLYYVINENRMYYRTSQGIINENKNCYIGTFYNSEDSSNGRITALNTKLSYRAMDYNDFINNGISNIICTTAPTTVSTASAQRPAVVVENYVNGTSGYYVRSDGYCEQWGYVLSVNKTTTITLLKKMIDTNYSIVCTGTESTGGGDNGSMNAYNPTTTGFNIYNTSDNISNCYWKATGYIS